MARPYRYLLLDVFTATPLAGNQLAVFLDAEGLSDAEMQALARETNLSETTFCFPSAAPPEDGVRVRIFTVEEELPFAGHPTLGTAAALRWAMPEFRDAPEIKLLLDAGVVPVRFEAGHAHAGDALPFGQAIQGEMEQPLPRFGQLHEPRAVAAALGLPIEALDAGKPIQTVSTGIPFVVVPLASLSALQALAAPRSAAQGYLQGTDGKFIYVLAPEGTPNTWRARMQFYGGEDPATGSAAGCATAYLVHHGFAPPSRPLRIEQGVEIGRPSLLKTRAVLTPAPEGAPGWAPASYVRVGGSTVLVAEGRFFLP